MAPRAWIRSELASTASSARRSLGATLLLLLMALGCSPWESGPGSLARSEVTRGFCAGGVPTTTRSAAGPVPSEQRSWGSHCPGQPTRGELVLTGLITRDGAFSLNVAGYPTHPNIEIAVRNPRSGERHALTLRTDPREAWQPFSFRLPERIRADAGPLELVVRDGVSAGAWIAVAEPTSDWVWSARPTLTLLMAIAFHGLLFLLPGIGTVAALARLRQRRGVDPGEAHSPLVPLVIAPALFGYLGFWAYWLDPLLGKAFSVAVYVASTALAALAAQQLGVEGIRKVAHHHATRALLLMSLAVVFYVLAAFMWGGEDTPFRTVAARYSHTLPLDNMIPMLLASGVYSGEIPKPFFGAWLSSDRPPLQAGLYVLQMPVISAAQFLGDKLHYQIAGVWFQATWIPALIWFLRRARANSALVSWILAATIFSAFALVNTTYVWPKLLPAALLLFPTAALVFEPSEGWKTSNAWAAFAGLCAALAMLGHGGSSFALLGIGATALLLRRMPSVRVTGIVIAVAVLSHLPWSFYQSFVDPPGNRLVKIHLAGAGASDDRGVLEAMREEYAKLDASEILRHKVENFAFLGRDLAGSARDLIGLANPWSEVDRPRTISSLRERMFHQIFHALGLLNFGFLALAWRALRRRPADPAARLAARSVGVASATAVLWCLLMFGPATTAINHSSYFILLMLFVGTTSALFAVRPGLAALCVSAHVVLTAFLYAAPNPSLQPPGMHESIGYASPDALMTFAAIAAGTALLGLLAHHARSAAWVREEGQS